MSRDTEITTNVFIQGYQVVPEAAAEIIENMESGFCPLCLDGDNEEFELPKAGDVAQFKCEACCVLISVEVWEA